MRFIGIDPSTKTGLVVLDESGNTVISREITYKGEDPKRMYYIIEKTVNEVKLHASKEKVSVCIEGFGFNSRQATLLGGIGWGLRLAMFRFGIEYTEVPPAQLKRFACGRGNASKEYVAIGVYKRWGFESTSNNITDAYVLAQIARAQTGKLPLTKFQKEVIARIS